MLWTFVNCCQQWWQGVGGCWLTGGGVGFLPLADSSPDVMCYHTVCTHAAYAEPFNPETIPLSEFRCERKLSPHVSSADMSCSMQSFVHISADQQDFGMCKPCDSEW
mmetsp:Transcript_29444/g.64709  ORF Transcript_29444/g.64709 Transcript_29444/m.64709 type:complete len:107 (-) Transcript_29444:240-560(-)